MEGSVEHWARRYVESLELSHKLSPPPPPGDWAHPAEALRLETPGRPLELQRVDRRERTPGPEALKAPERRARLLHTFLHHELQAAELMCWALLAFPDTAPAFRRGLLGICLDEIRHMAMYADHIEALGFGVGQFPVNDWFWQRVPAARTPASFVAVMGLGFEAANLDHTARFAARFRQAGDARGAQLQERVGEEEIPHVAFGAHWFRQLRGPLEFERWQGELPAPLSPMLMRGRPLNRLARERAGIPPDLSERLDRWQPTPPGS